MFFCIELAIVGHPLAIFSVFSAACCGLGTYSRKATKDV